MDSGVKSAFLSTPERRAGMLLRQHLSPAQSEDWTTYRSFNVKASSGKVWRVLGTGSSDRVNTLIDPRGMQRCMYPRRGYMEVIPAADTALSLMLMLMSTEPCFYGHTGEQAIERLACAGQVSHPDSPFWCLPQYAPDVREIYERHGENALVVEATRNGRRILPF